MKLAKLLFLVSITYFSTLGFARADENLYLQNLKTTGEYGLTEVAEAMRFQGISITIGFAIIGIGIAVAGRSIGKGIARKQG